MSCCTLFLCGYQNRVIGNMYTLPSARDLSQKPSQMWEMPYQQRPSGHLPISWEDPWMQEACGLDRPVKKAELTIISLLTDIPGPFHAWSREQPPSEQRPPRLEAVFHNNRKDAYWKLRWTIPDRQGCAEELRPVTSFLRRECMPAIFWPVNPFPHKVDEYEIMDCLHKH